MNKLLKILIGGIVTLVLLIAAILIYVVVAIDPNDYKPQIQEAAAEQDINLNIAGDLGWQLIPSLAIRIGETTISSSTQSVPDTRFDSASLSLAWLPLLKKQVHISAIAIDGADIRITSGAEATATAAAPVAASSGKSSDENKEDGAMGLAVDSIKITNSRITLAGEDQPLVLDKLFFEGKKVNLEGQVFPISLSFDFSDSSLPEALTVKLSTKIRVNQQSDELALEDLALIASGIELSADIAVTEMTGNPSISGSIKIPNTNLKKVLGSFGVALPDLPDKKALSKFSLEAQFSGSAEQAGLKELMITLDDTTITGNLSTKLTAPKKLNAVLKGGTIDLNRYMASSKSETEEGKTSSKTSSQNQTTENIFAPLAAPIAFLEGGSGNIDITWQKLTIDTLTAETTHLAIAMKGSTVNITDFSTNTLDGKVKATARLGNVTGRTPNLSYTADLTDISLAEAASAFADNADTGGTLTASVNGKSKGASGDQLFDNLTSQGTLQVVEPELKNINIEQSYCKIAALVENIPLKQDWPPGSKLNDLDGKFRMEGRTLLLDGLSSGVGNLSLNSNGTVDLGAGAFNILAVTRLNGDRTSETGCVVESTKLQNRDIPMRCKDTFADAGATSCRPDGDIVKQLARDKAIEKIGEKLNLDEETGQAVDSLLKGLFGGSKD